MKKFIEKFFPSKSGENARGKEVKSVGVHDTRVATCAVLLEMAKIDGNFSPEEQSMIIEMLRESFNLAESEVREIVDAAEKEIKGSIDYWHFADLIKNSYRRDEKKDVIKMVWKVVYADEKLDKHEDYLVHKLADLLKLSHEELIEIKIEVKKSRKS